MNEFVSFITGRFFISVFLAWISSVLLKWIVNKLTGKGKGISGAFANGGMPSSHSAFIASLSAGIYFVEGLSPVFYLSLAVALIVMSDAVRVRKNLGIQGDSLNKLLIRLKQNPIEVVHGHSLIQVITGAFWGIIVSTLVFNLI